MDPSNSIVRLCVEGTQAEIAGHAEAAHLLFTQAWEQHQNDYEACVAAHYVARYQATAEDTLRWNQEALDRANKVTRDEVASFYPSLYLNLGKSHEDLGNLQEARKNYELAAAEVSILPQDRYERMVLDGITRALQRVT